MSLMDQWNGTDLRRKSLSNDKDRLTVVRGFIKSQFGSSEEVSDFGKLYSDAPVTEMELAKVAVVLFSIGILDKNREAFTSPALTLSPELQQSLLTMLQSVIMTDSTELRLTHAIEEVLCEPASVTPRTASLSSSAESLLEESHSGSSNSGRASLHEGEMTPKKEGTRSHKNSGSSSLNFSLSDELTPLKNFHHFESSIHKSPVVSFVQSPQFIQKAVLRQKEMEFRELKLQLASEMLQKEEAQMSLCEQKRKTAEYAEEMKKLQERVRSLLEDRENRDDVLELQAKCSVMETTVAELHGTIADMKKREHQHKALEGENIALSAQVEKLHIEIELLKKSKQEETKKYWALCTMFEESRVAWDARRAWLEEGLESQEEMVALRNRAEVLKETNDRLKEELEELQARKACPSEGETMATVIDIKLKEVEGLLSLVTAERNELLDQLEEWKGKSSAASVNLRNVQEENQLLLSHLKALKASLPRSEKRIPLADVPVNEEKLLSQAAVKNSSVRKKLHPSLEDANRLDKSKSRVHAGGKDSSEDSLTAQNNSCLEAPRSTDKEKDLGCTEQEVPDISLFTGEEAESPAGSCKSSSSHDLSQAASVLSRTDVASFKQANSGKSKSTKARSSHVEDVSLVGSDAPSECLGPACSERLQELTSLRLKVCHIQQEKKLLTSIEDELRAILHSREREVSALMAWNERLAQRLSDKNAANERLEEMNLSLQATLEKEMQNAWKWDVAWETAVSDYRGCMEMLKAARQDNDSKDAAIEQMRHVVTALETEAQSSKQQLCSARLQLREYELHMEEMQLQFLSEEGQGAPVVMRSTMEDPSLGDGNGNASRLGDPTEGPRDGDFNVTLHMRAAGLEAPPPQVCPPSGAAHGGEGLEEWQTRTAVPDSYDDLRGARGTVLYFPLDKNGPVYPPPRLSLDGIPSRRVSGSFPASQSFHRGHDLELQPPTSSSFSHPNEENVPQQLAPTPQPVRYGLPVGRLQQTVSLASPQKHSKIFSRP
ncbi:flagellar attachment zone protein 1 [Aplysia californica]|uniref:Flagellar attachment zone protein 1 n=1 Tax=Aplysia californica TaxID=6500 RepID=A0ABM0ZXR8_APLCA|nr:flagellar attachment zone protein 1 [Aplysia californica]